MAVAIVAAVVLVVLRALGSLCLGVVVALVGGPAGDGAIRVIRGLVSCMVLWELDGSENHR